MGKAFRTALFGGFRKKDVIEYLEALNGPAGFDGTLSAKNAAEDAAALKERIEELENEKQEREQELSDLRRQLEETVGGRAEDQSLHDAASQALRQELERSEQAAQEQRQSHAALEQEYERQLEALRSEADAQRIRAEGLEKEVQALQSRPAGLDEQRIAALERQWQEKFRALCETDRRAQELTLAIRCEGAQRAGYDESLRRAERLLEDFRQELACMVGEIERLTRQLTALPDDGGRRQGGEKLSSPDDILHRVSSPRGIRGN